MEEDIKFPIVEMFEDISHYDDIESSLFLELIDIQYVEFLHLGIWGRGDEPLSIADCISAIIDAKGKFYPFCCLIKEFPSPTTDIE